MSHYRSLAFLSLVLFVLNEVSCSVLSTYQANDTEFKIETNGQLKVPKWLSDFTGLTEWPGLNPPYIPLDFIDLSMIPHSPRHKSGECSNVPNSRKICSFDCHNCVQFDDVYKCPRLSQTFDDGPLPPTLKLIENLKSRSTFFTLGVNVVQYPEIYRKTVQKGHIMGTHTWSHKFLPSLSNEEIVAQIEWSVWAMNATGGHLPKWFRPPYGGVDDRVRAIIRQFGLQSVLWNFDTFDWKLMDPTQTRYEHEIFRDLDKMKMSKRNTGLILEHDVYDRTVDLAIKINNKLGSNQLTVPQCVGGINYIKTFRPEAQ